MMHIEVDKSCGVQGDVIGCFLHLPETVPQVNDPKSVCHLGFSAACPASVCMRRPALGSVLLAYLHLLALGATGSAEQGAKPAAKPKLLPSRHSAGCCSPS